MKELDPSPLYLDSCPEMKVLLATKLGYPADPATVNPDT